MSTTDDTPERCAICGKPLLVPPAGREVCETCRIDAGLTEHPEPVDLLDTFAP